MRGAYLHHHRACFWCVLPSPHMQLNTTPQDARHASNHVVPPCAQGREASSQLFSVGTAPTPNGPLAGTQLTGVAPHMRESSLRPVHRLCLVRNRPIRVWHGRRTMALERCTHTHTLAAYMPLIRATISPLTTEAHWGGIFSTTATSLRVPHYDRSAQRHFRTRPALPAAHAAWSQRRWRRRCATRGSRQRVSVWS